MRYPILSPEEAAALINDGECVGLSGLTQAGAVKLLPGALAARAERMRAEGRPFRLTVMTSGTPNAGVDDVMAHAGVVARCMPFQSSPGLRGFINSGEVKYCDIHLSKLAQEMRYGHVPRVTTAIIEAAEVTEEGEIVLTTGAGNSACFCAVASRIIIELNRYHDRRLREFHDVYMPQDPPQRTAIPLQYPAQRIGAKVIKVSPEKIAAVVLNNQPDGVAPFKEITEQTARIGRNIVRFLENEYVNGRLPREFPPLQSGLGNVANAALAALGHSAVIPPFSMYTEVIQDNVIRLMQQGRCLFASSNTLTLSDAMLKELYANFDFFKGKILLRGMEISNNPEVIRRLGVISMNTAIEMDVCGNVNSSHLFGSNMMNGIGGSCDYARASRISIFSCTSTAKDGAISAIVPMVSHVDQTEHDVAVLVTEQGVADLRGLAPRERAERIVENCAHPTYRPLLHRYLELSQGGHSPNTLKHAFAFHTAYRETGSMLNAQL